MMMKNKRINKIKLYKVFKITSFILIIGLMILSLISLILAFNLNVFQDPRVAETFIKVWGAMGSCLVALSLPISFLYYLNKLNGILKEHINKDAENQKIKINLKKEIIKSKDIKIAEEEKVNLIKFKNDNIDNWIDVKKIIINVGINLSEDDYILILKELKAKQINWDSIRILIYKNSGKNFPIEKLKEILLN